MDDPTEIHLEESGIFRDFVIAYKASICGLLLYHPKAGLISSDPIGFASTAYPAVKFYPSEMQKQIRSGAIDLAKITDSLTYILINGCYESLCGQYSELEWLEIREKFPEVDFFRHVRNAASHKGSWSFRGNEPVRDARWRGKEISASMQGRKLFDKSFEIGDVFVLLSDIERILK